MPEIISTSPEVKITSAGKDIISSGTVNLFDKKDLRFSIGDIKMIMEFIDDKGEQRLEGEGISDTELKIKAYNFTNSLGSGTVEPMHMGLLHNRKLYVSFVVYALGGKDLKTVHYTFYLGEEVNE